MTEPHDNRHDNNAINASIRELTAQLHDLRDLMMTKFQSIEALNIERDKRYEQQFTNNKQAVDAALAAQEKAVNAAFEASEKAIVKAENAQAESNTKSNDYRGQLAALAATLLPRSESDVRFAAINDKNDARFANHDDRLEDAKNGLTKKIDDETAARIIASRECGDAIANLRESRSMGEGAFTTSQQDRMQSNWMVGQSRVQTQWIIALAISVGLAILGIIIRFL